VISVSCLVKWPSSASADWAVCLCSFPSLQESFGFRFGEKDELKAQFFFPKRKRELTFEHGAKRRWRNAVVRYLEKNGPATTSEIRQALGTTRRIAIALLENLDRTGVIRRDKDRRGLRVP
jgi:predicted HTH transcriptional regulator